MGTEDLEKTLGNFSHGESMSSGELKRALEELGEEEVDSKEAEPVPVRRRRRHGGGAHRARPEEARRMELGEERARERRSTALTEAERRRMGVWGSLKILK
jgi:hypothetical protein